MCAFQSLIEFSDQDAHELVNFLTKAEMLAKQNHLLAGLRLVRVIAPVVFTVLGWLGKR